MIEYRNEIVIWLTEQRNYRGGWISTQVRTVPSRVVPSYGSPSHACEVVILIQFHHKVLVILVQNNGFQDTVIALEAIVDFARTEEINTSRMVMHIVDENKKIDTFRLTQVGFQKIIDYDRALRYRGT